MPRTAHVDAVLKILKRSQESTRLFRESLSLVLPNITEEAYCNGLRSKDLEDIILTLSKVNLKKLTAQLGQKIIRSLIPVGIPSKSSLDEMILWLFSNQLELPISVQKTGLIWLIGLLENDIIDSHNIAWAYEKVFNGLHHNGLEAPCFRLLYLMTLPEQITRFRALRLLNMLKKSSNLHVVGLLGLYKTLRPDRVPESVSVVSAFEREIAGERLMLVGLAKTKARIEASEKLQGEIENRTSECKKRAKLHWDIQKQGRKNQAKGALLPTVAFISHQSSRGHNIFAQPRIIVENKDLHELGCYILSSKSPDQALSLLGSKGGQMYLQFCEKEVQQRFVFTLHHNLRNALVEANNKHVGTDNILELLVKLDELEGMNLKGSLVVTRFVSQFLRHYGRDNKFLPVVLRLMTRSIFTTFEELYTSLFTYLLTLFCSSDLEYKELILNAVGSLILNMLWSAQHCDRNEVESDSLVVMLRNSCNFYAKLCCITLASTNVNDCLSIIASALHFFKMVLFLELELNKVKMWTIPPSPLLLGCLLTAQPWLINSACDLFMQHKNKAYNARRSHKAVYSKQTKQLNKLASNYASHLFSFKSLENSDLNSPRSNLFCNIPEKTLQVVQRLCAKQNSLGLEYHIAMAPLQSVMQPRVGGKLEYEEILIYCKKYLPQLYEFIESFTEP